MRSICRYTLHPFVYVCRFTPHPLTHLRNISAFVTFTYAYGSCHAQCGRQAQRRHHCSICRWSPHCHRPLHVRNRTPVGRGERQNRGLDTGRRWTTRRGRGAHSACGGCPHAPRGSAGGLVRAFGCQRAAFIRTIERNVGAEYAPRRGHVRVAPARHRCGARCWRQ